MLRDKSAEPITKHCQQQERQTEMKLRAILDPQLMNSFFHSIFSQIEYKGTAFFANTQVKKEKKQSEDAFSQFFVIQPSAISGRLMVLVF